MTLDAELEMQPDAWMLAVGFRVVSVSSRGQCEHRTAIDPSDEHWDDDVTAARLSTDRCTSPFVMARLDRAIGINTMLRVMTRSSRAMTVGDGESTVRCAGMTARDDDVAALA